MIQQNIEAFVSVLLNDIVIFKANDLVLKEYSLDSIWFFNELDP